MCERKKSAAERARARFCRDHDAQIVGNIALGRDHPGPRLVSPAFDPSVAPPKIVAIRKNVGRGCLPSMASHRKKTFAASCALGINNAHRTTLLATEGKLSPCMIGRIRWASWSVRSIRPRPLALRLASRTALNANRSTILTISTITSRIVVHLLPTARHCPSRRRCVKQLFFKKMFRGKRDLRLLKPLFRAATARSVRRLPRKLGAVVA